MALDAQLLQRSFQLAAAAEADNSPAASPLPSSGGSGSESESSSQDEAGGFLIASGPRFKLARGERPPCFRLWLSLSSPCFPNDVTGGQGGLKRMLAGQGVLAASPLISPFLPVVLCGPRHIQVTQQRPGTTSPDGYCLPPPPPVQVWQAAGASPSLGSPCPPTPVPPPTAGACGGAAAATGPGGKRDGAGHARRRDVCGGSDRGQAQQAWQRQRRQPAAVTPRCLLDDFCLSLVLAVRRGMSSAHSSLSRDTGHWEASFSHAVAAAMPGGGGRRHCIAAVTACNGGLGGM